jgi:hypothetical protein
MAFAHILVSLRARSAALLLSSLLPFGCMPCNDIGCAGGFQWDASMADGSAIEPGVYDFEVTLDGARYTFACTVADTVGSSACSEPSRVEGERDFSVWVSLAHEGSDWQPEGPTGGFTLRAADVSGSDPDGSYSETRGPQMVRVQVRRDGEPFLDVDHAVSYERDHAYRGDERCGFCDSEERRTLEIDP